MTHADDWNRFEESFWEASRSELLTVFVSTPSQKIRILRLFGEVNLFTAEDFEQIVDGQLAAAPQALILDLTGLTFLGPDGMSVLFGTAYRAGTMAIGFSLACLNESAANAIAVAGLIEMFDVHDTVEDALITYG
jgi:anti-sigma B factor antagonist